MAMLSMFFRRYISIHAPTRGATVHLSIARHCKYDFNPRSYKRSDELAEVLFGSCIISIHAPTRGAT